MYIYYYTAVVVFLPVYTNISISFDQEGSLSTNIPAWNIASV